MTRQGQPWTSWAAELAGTALLVLGSLSGAAFALGDGSPLEGLPTTLRFLTAGVLGGATVTLIAASPLGTISGAHINPAVTVAFRVMGRVRGFAGYLAAQLAGAAAGAVAFRVLWGSAIGGGVTHPTVPTWLALALEAGMTALLVAAIFLFVSSERLMRFTPLMLTPVLTVLIWLGSPQTGASLNPARSEGPAFVYGDFADLWLYLLAPIAGALAAALSWRRLHERHRPMVASLCPARSLFADEPSRRDGRADNRPPARGGGELRVRPGQ